MLRINNISLDLEYTQEDLIKKSAQILGVSKKTIKKISIAKLSVDSRKKNSVHFVGNFDVTLKNTNLEDDIFLRKIKNVKKSFPYEYVLPKNQYKGDRPVIIGFGPAGMFSALILAMKGLKPIIIERGKTVDKRIDDVQLLFDKGILNEESNIQFGEGGAGTFSDGKLNSGVKDERIRFILEEFVSMGAPEEILYKSAPHIGTDKLRLVVRNLRKKIESLGGTFYFETKLTDFTIKNDRVVSISVENANKNTQIINVDILILAIGHSARDTIEMLHAKGVQLQQKPFSVGVRIEHLRKDVDKAQYGDFAGHPKLGTATYKLSHHTSTGRGVYTFCMCPGGQVVCSSSEKGYLATNGMSDFARKNINSNSALLVSVFPNDFADESPLAGVRFQRNIEKATFVMGGENYSAPIQKVEDFLLDRETKCLGKVIPSYKPSVVTGNISSIFPNYITYTLREGIECFSKKISVFSDGDAILTASETRSSSPVTILRNRETYQSVSVENLYPIGEGAGYAGGIISAALDGIKCAEII